MVERQEQIEIAVWPSGGDALKGRRFLLAQRYRGSAH